jgi:hypothetical protein
MYPRIRRKLPRLLHRTPHVHALLAGPSSPADDLTLAEMRKALGQYWLSERLVREPQELHQAQHREDSSAGEVNEYDESHQSRKLESSRLLKQPEKAIQRQDYQR